MTLKLFTFIFTSLILLSCSNDFAVEECVARGVAYFKEIGSYPRLESPPNEGRTAEDVSRERCNRTTSAF
jgi:hypothetical protein